MRKADVGCVLFAVVWGIFMGAIVSMAFFG